MKNNDLVSIIMPTYNREKTIQIAVDSILNQTYSNIELIIVDDGSKDKTIEKLQKINDERIKIFKLDKNMGANYARNFGIKKATGKYITFQDSDDIADLIKIEELLNFVKQEKCEVVFCNIRVKKKNKYKEIIKKQMNDDEVLNKLLWGNFISTEALLCERKVFKEISFDSELPRFQDWDLVIRIAQKYNIKHFNKSLLTAIVQNDSITRNHTKGIIALEKILTKYSNLFNHKQIAKIYCRIGIFCALDKKYANDWFINAYKKDIKYYIIYILNKLNLIKFLYYIKEKI